MQLKTPIFMAQIGAPHGIKGEVRVKPFCEDPQGLGEYGSLYTEDGRKFKIVRLRPSKNMLVVKFKGINFRDEAEAINGTKLYIDRSMLPDDIEEDEFYITDMIDCRVIDESGEEIGKVVAVPNFGAGDLLEIALNGSSQSLLLEFSKKNVPTLDLENQTITISRPAEVSERDDNQ